MRSSHRPERPAPKYVSLTCLLVLLMAPASMAQQNTAYSLKQDAVALLEDLRPTGHSRTDRNLEKAIDAIEDSLVFQLWIDDNHLLVETGAEVFQAERRAMRRLEDVLEDGFAPAEPVEDAIVSLISADATLVEIAINGARAAEGVADCDAGSDGDSDSDNETDCDCSKARHWIAGALAQQRLAFEAFEADAYQTSIQAFLRAWKESYRGRFEVAECPILNVVCPCVDESMPVFTSFVDKSRPVAGCSYEVDGDDVFIMTIDVPASFAEVLIVPGEDLATCTEQDRIPFPAGPISEYFLTPAAAAGCVDLLRDLVEECPCDSDPDTPIPQCEEPTS